MRIYLAARYSRREELNDYKADLEAMGHVVTSRWLSGEHKWDGEGVEHSENDDMLTVPPEIAQRFAMDDLEDIDVADALIAFTEVARTGPARGGRHVELGYALGRDLIVFAVGPVENVFVAHPSVTVFDRWEPDRISKMAEQYAIRD